MGFLFLCVLCRFDVKIEPDTERCLGDDGTEQPCFRYSCNITAETCKLEGRIPDTIPLDKAEKVYEVTVYGKYTVHGKETWDPVVVGTYLILHKRGKFGIERGRGYPLQRTITGFAGTFSVINIYTTPASVMSVIN